MSFNHLKFDHCHYNQINQDNTTVLSYLLDDTKFENVHKCMNERGLVGGSVVADTRASAVDV